MPYDVTMRSQPGDGARVFRDDDCVVLLFDRHDPAVRAPEAHPVRCAAIGHSRSVDLQQRLN
jgi:hypothetical protein